MARKTKYPVTEEGTELTPEALDAMVKEAEEGFDLSEWRICFIERPSTGTDDGPDRDGSPVPRGTTGHRD
jgi:hypothetical protein